jgi:hypothetical protein
MASLGPSTATSHDSPCLCVSVRKMNEQGGQPDAYGAGVRDFVLSGARESRAPRSTRKGAGAGGAPWGPRDAEPVISPVSCRSPVCRFFFSDDWLRHARFGEPHSAAAPLARVACTTPPPLVAWASSPRRVDHLWGGGCTVGRMPTAPWGVMVAGHHSAPCGAMVAWASSPRKDHSPSQQRPHNGQDARRIMGIGSGSGSVSDRDHDSGGFLGVTARISRRRSRPRPRRRVEWGPCGCPESPEAGRPSGSPSVCRDAPGARSADRGDRDPPTREPRAGLPG